MAAGGAIGAVFDELLRHASELLDFADDELVELDRPENAAMFATAVTLRAR